VAVPIVMPKLGLTMESATVVVWHKREGDRVEKGETIVEVETDKIVNEVQSPASGIVLKVLVAEGTEAKVQTLLAVIGEPGEDLAELLRQHPSPSEARSRGGDQSAPRPGADAAKAGGWPGGRGSIGAAKDHPACAQDARGSRPATLRARLAPEGADHRSGCRTVAREAVA